MKIKTKPPLDDAGVRKCNAFTREKKKVSELMRHAELSFIHGIASPAQFKPFLFGSGF